LFFCSNTFASLIIDTHNMKKITLRQLAAAVLLCLTTVTLTAQQTKRAFVPCFSNEYNSHLHAKRSTTGDADFEKWLAPKIAAVQQQKNKQAAPQVVTLPVVVHIIHDGDDVGISENIPDERVLSQIQVLNEDFRRLQGTRGYVEGNAGTDTQIEFCLAQRDPNGQATNGITRHTMDRYSWNSMEDVDGIIKAETGWDPTKYINIWVCRFGGDLIQLGGYAYFPEASGLDGLDVDPGSISTAAIDGIVMSFKAFGSADTFPATTYFPESDLGRATTHEMGHFLGLRHIWGDEDSCEASDFCDDTPAVVGLHFDCTPMDSCPENEGVDMIENHMDYTPDACKSIYTEGQKARMWAVLQNSPRRISLLTSDACTPPVLGTGDNNFEQGLNIYPNPVKDMLTVSSGTTAMAEYGIYTLLGQQVATGTIDLGTQATINTSALSKGIYILTISSNGKTKTLKFIKE
jgi:hypothetical protein